MILSRMIMLDFHVSYRAIDLLRFSLRNLCFPIQVNNLLYYFVVIIVLSFLSHYLNLPCVLTLFSPMTQPFQIPEAVKNTFESLSET